MIETEEAVEITLKNIRALGTERVSVFEALGRVIAAPALSRRDLPPGDISAMDGYALIASDTEKAPAKLKVKGVIAAGDGVEGLSVKPGTAYRIMTGALMPEGADSVVQHELTDNGRDETTVNVPVKKGFCVRKKGEDMTAGAVIDRTGERVTPYHIARFVSAGIFYISVYRRPRVAVISTGSEIADPETQDDPLKVFDSNAPLMKAMFEELGAEVSYLGVIPDDADALIKVFSDLGGFDMVVTSAGISAGDFDFMNIIADKLGIKWEYTTINQKPGMHMSFGRADGRVVFACPGNPVSSMFCVYYYVKPALLKMSGLERYRNVPVKARLAEGTFKKKGRVEFIRVKLTVENGVLAAYPFASQDSHRIESLVSSNAFVRFGNDAIGEIPAGTEVDAYVFDAAGVF